MLRSALLNDPAFDRVNPANCKTHTRARTHRVVAVDVDCNDIGTTSLLQGGDEGRHQVKVAAHGRVLNDRVASVGDVVWAGEVKARTGEQEFDLWGGAETQDREMGEQPTSEIPQLNAGDQLALPSHTI